MRKPAFEVLEIATIGQQRIARGTKLRRLRFQKGGNPMLIRRAHANRPSSMICNAARRAASSNPKACSVASA